MGGYTLRRDIQDLDPVDMAYAAGFLDGEGYFSDRLRGGVEVKVDCVNPHPLLWLRDTFGGSLRRYSRRDPKCRTYWRWRVYGDPARALCLALLPMFRIKRAEAEAIAFSKEYPHGTEMRRVMYERASKHRAAEYNQ